MIAPDLIAGIWGLSLCLWGLFNIYTIFRIERFIVKRYEQETDLLNTDFLQTMFHLYVIYQTFFHRQYITVT
jgi:exosortase/archaeosortase